MNSNKLLKRTEKKLRKHQHIVSRETGVTCSQEPSKHLAICNAGQANGLTEEVIVASFGGFGKIERIVVVPGKSCCFLSYKELSSAIKAYEMANGKLNIAQDGKPVFLSYIESLPAVKEDKVWNCHPPGLFVLENFITEAEEDVLFALCNFEASEGVDSGVMKNRQVKHFGYEFRYDTNNVDKDKPLPEGIPKDCSFLWERLKAKGLPFGEFHPDQLTVNHYKPGQGIPPHIDTHSAFEDPIVSLSLGADTVMEFKKDHTVCVLLPRRSMTIISGEARYDWTHGITPRKFGFYFTEQGCTSFKQGTRVSYTFRRVLREASCRCRFKRLCDSYNSLSNGCSIENNIAARLESQHVYDVYEDIAGHFSDTRHKPWPNVLSFVDSFQLGAVLLDVGCGNGKYFGHNRTIFEVGLDRSFKLNEVCRERGFETCTGNCLQLPLKDSSVDGAISIAVIHHLASHERRVQAVKEILRMLRIGGKALIYVWAKKQTKDDKKSSYIKQGRTTELEQTCMVDGVSLPIHTNRTEFNHSDLLVPWKLRGKGQDNAQTFLRFYHVFEEGELEDMCQSLDGVSIVKSFYDQGNYCVIFKKIK